MTTVIDGNAVAADVRGGLRDAIETLADRDARPTLATVLMNDDPASETYVSLKHQDCEEVGIESRDVAIDPEAPAEELYGAIAALNEDDDVDGYIVQSPVADHVDYREVVRRVDPTKDVDAFHPENVGRLVAGNARFKPCTPHGVQKLLDAAGVETEGADAVVVGRSEIVGKPMANLLLQKEESGNATVTVCHSRTEDLAAKTREADIVVAAAGVPELVDGEMLSAGVTVVDVGYNHVERDGEKVVVGDVAYQSAEEKADAITPVPGGVGPMTRAMLLWNTVKAAGRHADVDVSLP